MLARSRRRVDSVDVKRLAEELAERQEAQAHVLVERVVGVAGESFDSRLKAGAAELEHRGKAIDLRMDGAQQRLDEKLAGVVASLQAKVDEVDKLVVERVGGLSSTIDEKVGGMSKNLGQQVTTYRTYELAVGIPDAVTPPS